MVDLVAGLGFQLRLAPARPTGEELHVPGLLSRFRTVAARTAATLRALSDAGARLVGIDPAMTLVFRGECRETLGDAALDVRLLREWLSDVVHPPSPVAPVSTYSLIPHCTERAMAGDAVAVLAEVFRACGIGPEILCVGCCGMSGTFGHETRRRDLSTRIYDMSWRNGLRDLAGSGRASRLGIFLPIPGEAARRRGAPPSGAGSARFAP